MPEQIRVYLSYTIDTERQAVELQEQLGHAGIVTVSGRDTEGSAWGSAVAQIRDVDAMIVLVGEGTYRSQWVEAEIDQGLNYNVPVVAVRTSRSSVSPINLYGARVNWVNSFSIDRIQEVINTLVVTPGSRAIVSESESNIVNHRVDGAPHCILFIHGFGGDAYATWGDFPRLLVEEPRLNGWDVRSFGYATSLMPDGTGLWTGDPDIPVVARQLITSVESELDYTGFTLIGHSMGGLVAQRAILDDEKLRNRLTNVFLFGTPSAGLIKAWPFRFSLLRLLKRQASSMGWGSAYIMDLRSRWDEMSRNGLPFKMMVVAGAEDEFVPIQSSLDPFPTELSAVVSGDHLSIVKPADASNPSVQLVIHGIAGDADPAGRWSASRVATERLQFNEVINQLWDQRTELDDAAARDLALALDAQGRRVDAIALLEARAGTNTDAMGVLAGRYKRRWIADRREADARRSLELYEQGYRAASDNNDHAQAYYLGINIAFLKLVFGGDIRASRETAIRVLNHCHAVEPSEELGTDRMWRLATEAEAHLILGDLSRADDLYGRATEGTPAPTPRQRDSMFNQALRIANELGDDTGAEMLQRRFKAGEGTSTSV